MFINKIKSEGLSHNSYFIGSENEAIVIDPRRDCQLYIDIAQQEEITIKGIFETHRNEDYIIGSIELAKRTGAKIYHGSKLDFKYGQSLTDDQEFFFGKIKLITLETPGHTDESMSYALADLDVSKKPIMVFTGDTLFVGDVGRTDLYGSKEAPRLAAALYDSIFNRLLPLGDEVLIFPGHGAGSVCGGDISQREDSTLGIERAFNPLLQKSREEFINYKVNEHHTRPYYFLKMEKYNLEGPPLFDKLPSPSPLMPQTFLKQMKLGAIVVDTRQPPSFGGAYLKDTYNIWLERIPSYAGWTLPYDKPILLILEDKIYLKKAVRYLYRIGYDNLIGYLVGGIEGWYKQSLPLEHFGLISVQELKTWINKKDDLFILDVREDEKWKQGHITDSVNIFSGYLEKRINELPTNRQIAIVCNIGNRASLAASILTRAGFRNVHNVLGGMIAWKNAGFEVST
ncbi:rhodanese-like domain-containing protein [Thermoproteota archaeon]